MFTVAAIVIGVAVCVGGGFYLGYRYGKAAVDAVKDTASKL